MTEADWLHETRPTAMLYPLLLMRLKTYWMTWFGLKSVRWSERKLRLFVCGCARQVWPALAEPERRVVEACERRADGGAADTAGVEAACAALGEKDSQARRVAAVALVAAPWFPFQFDLGGWVVTTALRSARTLKDLHADEDAGQCHLLRDVFTPFRQFTADASWLSWRGGLVPAMAATVYDERRFEEMPVLADALEEAGCTDADVLAHCRAGGEHVRGCWVLDALLGRE